MQSRASASVATLLNPPNGGRLASLKGGSVTSEQPAQKKKVT